MKDSHKRLLQQMAELAEEGKFGESIKASREEYAQLSAGVATLLRFVRDTYAEKPGINDDVRQMRDIFCQLIIVAYRDAARANQEAALALAYSFIGDYPGIPESCLAPQACSLMQTALGFREVADSTNRLLMWEQMRLLVLAYNEFLNGLLGYIIPCIRCSQGKPPNANAFSATYTSKIEQLNSLTGGEEGAFYLIPRLARPKIRNAIAHHTIWLDAEAAKVRYIDGLKDRREYEIDLMQFGLLALLGSHLAEPYLAAIATTAVMEAGTDLDKASLPRHLVRLFDFNKGRT